MTSRIEWLDTFSVFAFERSENCGPWKTMRSRINGRSRETAEEDCEVLSKLFEGTFFRFGDEVRREHA